MSHRFVTNESIWQIILALRFESKTYFMYSIAFCFISFFFFKSYKILDTNSEKYNKYKCNVDNCYVCNVNKLIHTIAPFNQNRNKETYFPKISIEMYIILLISFGLNNTGFFFRKISIITNQKGRLSEPLLCFLYLQLIKIIVLLIFMIF